MTEMSARIPQERVAVLIGPKGTTRSALEKQTGTKVAIDSETGEVTITGEDAISVMSVCEYVKAIGRGFSPQRSKKLLTEGYYLLVIDIREIVGRSKKRIPVIRGRLIGRRGRVRELIEEHSGAMLSVMGNTVSVIGTEEEIETAKVAVDMVLHGAEHHSVFSFLEKKRRDLATPREIEDVAK
jgi:ribosomal RNA assembly protein